MIKNYVFKFVYLVLSYPKQRLVPAFEKTNQNAQEVKM